MLEPVDFNKDGLWSATDRYFRLTESEIVIPIMGSDLLKPEQKYIFRTKSGDVLLCDRYGTLYEAYTIAPGRCCYRIYKYIELKRVPLNVSTFSEFSWVRWHDTRIPYYVTDQGLVFMRAGADRTTTWNELFTDNCFEFSSDRGNTWHGFYQEQ